MPDSRGPNVLAEYFLDKPDNLLPALKLAKPMGNLDFLIRPKLVVLSRLGQRVPR